MTINKQLKTKLNSNGQLHSLIKQYEAPLCLLMDVLAYDRHNNVMGLKQFMEF
jgi:hypothetical protein